MQRSFGTGAATNSVIDIKYTDCMMVIGANPTAAHPVTGAKMKQAAMKGTKLIVIDPREIELAKYADHFLQLRPGTNVALLNMMLYYIIEEDLADNAFIETRTEGYDDFVANIKKLDINAMESITGVAREEVRAAAITYASAPNAMSFHGLGVTEHSQGTFTVQQIADPRNDHWKHWPKRSWCEPHFVDRITCKVPLIWAHNRIKALVIWILPTQQ